LSIEHAEAFILLCLKLQGSYCHGFNENSIITVIFFNKTMNAPIHTAKDTAGFLCDWLILFHILLANFKK